jgi:hypothetical protein
VFFMREPDGHTGSLAADHVVDRVLIPAVSAY